MSSILDALKKSERQRSLGRDLVFRNASPDASARLTGFAIAVLASLLVLAAALAALLFSLREPEPPPPTATSAETSTMTADRATRSAETGAEATVAPVPATRKETAHGLDSKTRPSSRTVAPVARPATAKPQPSVDTPRAPIQPQPVTASGEAPWLSSLPASFRSSLPPLSVNIHVYSPEESQRILYINNRPARQGERIEGGVVVEEIVHDGVVLQFRGQRFKLPRPS